MRTSLILCLLCLSSCIFHDLGLNSGIARYNTEGSRNSSSGSSSDSYSDFVDSQFDTAIYVCAVAYSDSYDWQSDPSYGTEPYELILYKDFEEILRISSTSSTCVSPDHDTHHIIDGQLYTEYSGTSYTAIGLNGVEILRFSSREFLKGLLPHEGDLYTLSQKRDGTGFTLRKNGDVMLTKTSYNIFGGMNDPSYGETGALYLDEDVPTFCYWGDSEGYRKYYRVKNGVEEELGNFSWTDYDDIKSIGGEIYISAINFEFYSAINCKVWHIYDEYAGTYIRPEPTFSGNIVIAGSIGNALVGTNRKFMGLYLYGTGIVEEFVVTESEGTMYCTQDANAVVFELSDNTVEFVLPDSSTKTESDCYFFSANCATLVGNKFVYAVSSRTGNVSPKVWTGKTYRQIPIHGYVSRVGSVVTPKDE